MSELRRVLRARRFLLISLVLAFSSVVAVAGLSGRGTVARFFSMFSAEAAAAPLITATPGDELTFGTCDTAGPIEVESSGGTTAPTAYATLKAAFDAVNAGTHTGTVTVEVCGNTTETASASLNAGDIAPASYTAMTIRPVGAARIIEGSITGAVVKLNGADNVTIDGRIGGTGTARSLTVRNNSAVTATAAIWLASVAAGNGASNNVIRNLEIAAGQTATTGTLTTIGLYMGGTTISLTATDGNDNDNNQFLFNRFTRARYGLATRGVTTNNNIAPIIADNIVGPSSFGADEIGKVGIFLQADAGAVVTRNTVQFVGGDLVNSTAGADRCGICIGSETWSTTDSTTITSGEYTVTKNIIHDIVEERTFSSIGIKLGTTRGGTATNNLVANNFIYNVRSNGTTGDQLVGIGYTGGHTDRIVHNSISLTGDMDPGAAALSTTYGNAIRVPGANGTNNVNLSLLDNSVYLDASSGTAANRYYAITLNSSAYVFGTGGLNYNNYYINAANPQVKTGGLATTATTSAATTEFQTLANWQTALTAPQDANSIQADPLYSSAASDLRVFAASPNINAGTTVAGVTDDIDEQVRPNGAAADIGADEFYALPGTLQLSANSYTGNEGSTATITVNRVLGSTGAVGATYSLSGGTATGGANCGAGIDYVNTGGTVAFADSETLKTITVPLCTDAVVDVAETFSVVLSAPTGGASLGSPSSAVVTITDIPPPFAGTYSVGAGQSYTSLTNAGGIFEALNLAGATSNVTIEIVSDLTGENGAVALNELAGGFSVTIKPTGAARTISGASTSGIIRLNGADNVTIDGSLTGGAATGVGGNAALRNLTVVNTSTTATAGTVIAITQGSNSANSVTVKNVNVSGQDPAQTLIGIHVGGNTIGGSPTVASNTNIVVDNCSFQKSIFGIFNNGVSAAIPATGSVISHNDLSATGTSRLRRGGIFFFNQNGIQVTDNKIGGIVGDESADAIGIIAGIQNVTTTSVTSGGVYNALISRNKIDVVTSTSATGFSAAGIAIAGDPLGANTVSNNMITGVSAPSTSPDFTSGIFVAGVPSSNTKVLANSVSLTGARGSVAAQIGSYGIAISGADPTVELKDNIFYTTQTSAGGTAAKSYAIGMTATTFANLDSNYNVFYSSGANAAGFRTGSLDTTGTDIATLAAWQTAVADDANSVAVDPLFVSDVNDLHLQPSTSPTTVVNAGTPLAAVTLDFDGQARSTTIPDIGADELDSIAPDTQILTNPTNPSNSNSATFTFTGTDSAIATVASFECKLDSGSFTVCTSPQNYSGLSQGSHNFQVRAIDAAGNVDPTPASFNWAVDAIAPDTQLLTTPTDPSSSGSATFTFTGTDTVAQGVAILFECKLDAGAFASCSSPKSYTGLADGSHTFQVRAKDFVGNVDPTPASFTWTISTIPTGPVAVSATSGTTGPTNYPTLKAAFDAINAGTHLGALTVVIVQDTTETATAVLNESGSGAASYTSVSIQPIGGGARTVSGDIAGPLVDLNGADNVTINGLNSGGNGLTLSNISQQVSASTIRFINDASNNTVTNTSIFGSTGAALSSGFGVVYFATGTVTGNDNNTISNNAIGAAGSALPINGIYSLGTSAAIDNSGITVSGNNISDFFNTNSASNGINANTGNSAWTITNNKLFQTGSRTYLTAATHSAINVGSGSGYSVSGNTIGFASAAGTGTYTMAGAVATRFVGINLAVGTTNDTSVQGNTIASISLGTSSGAATTSGVLCGVNITSGNVNVGNVTPNTFGSTTGTGSLAVVSTTTQAAIVGVHSASVNTVVISNNTFGAFTSASPTAGIAGAVFGVNVSGAATSMTITGNTIGNATADNMRAGVVGTTTGSSLAGGINQTAVPAISNYSNNTIRNLASYGTGTGGYVRGIQTSTVLNTTAVPTINGNTITNLTTSGAVSGQTSANTSAYGIQLISGTGASISGNTISNISNINAGAVGTVVAGIAHASAINTVIANNTIFGLSNASTATSTTLPGAITGVLIRSGTTNTTVQNNMIALGTGQATNSAIFGIWANHGSTPDPADRIYFNTVDIEGTVTSGAQPSAAFHRGDLSTTAKLIAVDVRNNIFVNNRSGGTGKHYAIANHIGAATSSATGWTTVNNNVLNAVNPATVGFWTTDQTFAGWKAASGGDLVSFSGIPVTFVSSANNLHLNMGLTATPIESGGATIAGVTTDIDGQTRPGPTGSTNGGAFAPDLGADEFDGVYLDLAAPVISYTALANTTLTTNRVLAVNVIDGTGVAGGANLPRVYFKKATDASFVSTACALTSGTPQNGNYDCTIDYTLVGGGSAATFDTIQYFVVAQDTLGNVSSNPSAGFSGTSVNTVTTPPTSPSFYLITGSFSGAYTVGTGGTFTSLTNAGGLFSQLNAGTVTGNVTINIVSDLTGETGTVLLNEFASGFTVTIKPSGAARSISGTSSAASGLLGFNGADGVTIDGSLSGGNDRSLTIASANTATTGGGIYFASGTNGAQNNTVKNVNVVGGGSTTGILLGVAFAGNTFGGLGVDNDNNRIENCDVRGAFYGIASLGASTANKDTGTVITRNLLSGTGTAGIGRVGIYVLNSDGAQITANSIASVANPGNVDTIGIAAGSQAISNVPATTGGISNALISGNYVGVVSNNATFSAAGIVVASDVTGTNNIVNNMVTGVTGNSNGGDIVVGIYVNPLAGATQNVYHNSVSMTGDRGSATTNLFPSYALAIGSDQPVNVVDNALFNSQTRTGSAGTGGESFAIGFDGAAANVNLLSNYNDLFVAGPNGVVGITGDLTSTAQTTTAGTGTNQTTLTAWRTATSEDANSISVDPLFTSLTDLHIAAGGPLVNVGTNVGVTVDFDGQTRDATPDIGADEIVVVATPGTLAFSAPTASIGEGSGLASLTVSRTGGTSGLVGATYSLGGGTATGGASCTTGIDYLNAGGTVSFADGETSKVITVQICPDSVAESNETFNVTLSAPTGGATIGSQSTAMVLINDLTGSAGDFDGDGKADLAILRTNTGSTSLWSLRESNGGAIRGYQWGLENDVATPADFDGDGKLDIAVWRAGAPTVAAFYILNSSNQTVRTELFGQTGDNPVVVADYDGDGKADPAVYRGGAQSFFYYRGSLNNPSGNVTFIPWGTTGDRPAVGDFNGNGKADFAVNRGGQWWILSDSGSSSVTNYGTGTDKLVPADYDGDGKTDIAVFRPSDTTWYVLKSTTGTSVQQAWGLATDILVPGDYDGDGKSDLAVYRGGTWFILSSLTGGLTIDYFGNATDYPVANAKVTQ